MSEYILELKDVVKTFGGGIFVRNAHRHDGNGHAVAADHLFHLVGARLGGVASAPTGAEAEPLCGEQNVLDRRAAVLRPIAVLRL